MLNVNGIELDFDITSPSDMLRYKQATEHAELAYGIIIEAPKDINDPRFIDVYISYLNAELRVFGDYLDELFGDGIAKRLLGSNPSLNKVTEVNDALESALEAQGRDFGVKLQKYTPNRATRRANKS